MRATVWASMYELEVADYDRARAAFQGMEHHLAVQAILEGSVPARILVDDPIRPRAAFTWRKQRFYLSGVADNKEFNGALGRFLVELIDLQWQADGSDLFVLHYAPEAWESQLEEMLGAGFPVRVERQYYEFRAMQHDWRSLLPEGFAVQLVDRSLLEQAHLANLGDLMKEMSSERQSTEDFFGKSFGVCVLQGDEIVGWCLSEYNSADRCEVGIEVVKPYRRRGLGRAMTCALVEHALSEGVSRIGWHCYASNAASRATARRAGFERVQDYTVYLVRLDAQHDVDRTKAVAAEIDAEIRCLAVQNTPNVSSQKVGESWGVFGRQIRPPTPPPPFLRRYRQTYETDCQRQKGIAFSLRSSQ
jgi:RimJ/RimL family protein N-acetyltransferase